jgi:hypothetical protein
MADQYRCPAHKGTSWVQSTLCVCVQRCLVPVQQRPFYSAMGDQALNHPRPQFQLTSLLLTRTSV